MSINKLTPKEDAIIRALLYLFIVTRLYNLFNASIFNLIYLDLFDFLIKDKHNLFAFQNLGYIGGKQRYVNSS